MTLKIEPGNVSIILCNKYLLQDCKNKIKELEKKLKKVSEEKEKLETVVRENNEELKSMECSLTGKNTFTECRHIVLALMFHLSFFLGKNQIGDPFVDMFYLPVN